MTQTKPLDPITELDKIGSIISAIRFAARRGDNEAAYTQATDALAAINDLATRLAYQETPDPT